MHFMVAWQADEELPKLSIEMVNCFSGYKFAQLMNETYAVSVDNSEEYKAIYSKLMDVAKSNNTSRLIITPLMSAGRYIGWRTKDVWAEANRVSEAEV